VQPKRYEKRYELVFVVHPDRTDEEARKAADRLKDVVAREGGEVMKVEEWGKRKLAYEVRKQSKGTYFLMLFSGDGRIINEVERTCRISDDTLRYLTVQVDEKALAAAPAAPAAVRRPTEGEDLGEEGPVAAIGGAEAEAE
jgi:small subunit ribosomal protein S6